LGRVLFAIIIGNSPRLKCDKTRLQAAPMGNGTNLQATSSTLIDEHDLKMVWISHDALLILPTFTEELRR
jgi:hypothetical protein